MPHTIGEYSKMFPDEVLQISKAIVDKVVPFILEKDQHNNPEDIIVKSGAANLFIHVRFICTRILDCSRF
jgi:hypothetical protein